MAQEKKLDAVVNIYGQVVAWKCAACNWTKLPENPPLISKATEEEFERHACEEHPRKYTAYAKRLAAALLYCVPLSPDKGRDWKR